MKKVTVNAYQVALVFKNDAYEKMLRAGSYWIWNTSSTAIYVYDLDKNFVPLVDLNILLQDAELAASLETVDVRDNEIVLVYENELLKKVLTSGHYAFWKGIINYRFVKADIGKIEITEPIDRNTLQHKLLVPFVRNYVVESYEKALLFIDGKYAMVLPNGVYSWWKNAVTIVVGKVDLRQQQLEINGQELLTKDKAALRLNAQVQYCVTDIEKALLQNKDYDKQLYVTLQLALREYIGSQTLDEMLEKKDAITPYILEAVKSRMETLGVVINGFGIRDIILPGEMKEIMNRVLIAEKTAQANTIMRREETASTRSLLNTAKLMEENAMLWKLKEMEYVEKIADKISNISVNGSGDLIGQLKQIFVSR